MGLTTEERVAAWSAFRRWLVQQSFYRWPGLHEQLMGEAWLAAVEWEREPAPNETGQETTNPKEGVMKHSSTTEEFLIPLDEFASKLGLPWPQPGEVLSYFASIGSTEYMGADGKSPNGMQANVRVTVRRRHED